MGWGSILMRPDGNKRIESKVEVQRSLLSDDRKEQNIRERLTVNG